jgi:sulfate adenylyltransferase subunit 1
MSAPDLARGAVLDPTSAGTELLRMAAVGAVDDGKSTLIGRLLHDSRQLLDDQLRALADASHRRGLAQVDLAFVTDGLRAEREQGITIDVAYRYAATPKRKLIIADCPGHVQYTRNMATGSSTAELVVLVVDARHGLREQTRRHLCIAALLGVRRVVVAANKMDLAGWSEEAFSTVLDEVSSLARRLGMEEALGVPVSALHGDWVVEPSRAAPWYSGPTLIEVLEEAPAHGASAAPARLPVQWVVRLPGGGRAYAGMLSGSSLRPGDPVVALPSALTTTVSSIETFDGPLEEASGPLSVTVHLADDLDVGRGDLLAPAAEPPSVTSEVEATVCWFGNKYLAPGHRYRLKHTTRTTRAVVRSVSGRLDVNDLVTTPAGWLAPNDIGLTSLAVATPLAVDPYRVSRSTGSFILIEEGTNATVGAGMVGPPPISA